MSCEICELIKNKKKVILEDNDVVAMLHPRPATAGHIIIVPKQHIPIIENCPDSTVGKIFNLANKISTIVFESLQAHGTNMLVQNGVAAGQSSAHFMLHVIPRRENDGLNFQWQPKKSSDDELSTAELQLKEHTGKIGIEKEDKKPIEVKKEEIEEISGEENYLIKQLERIP